METLGSLRRTNYCGEVTLAMAGQEMTVCGSIARARDKGGIIFADLRDTTGILQLVFDEDTPKDVFAKAESLKSEYVVICRGKLRERAAKTDKIATGDVELCVSELRILSEAQTTPFELRDEINVNDDLRLRYRYLDLRRPSMHEPIVLRSRSCRSSATISARTISPRSRRPPHQVHARGRARLSRSQPCAAGPLLRAAPEPAALQADFDAVRL